MTDQDSQAKPGEQTKNPPLSNTFGPFQTVSNPKANRCRNGKVARLPKNLRDLINQMLDDSATYSAIIQKLQQEHHTSLNPENLSNWYADGYQDWPNLHPSRSVGPTRRPSHAHPHQFAVIP